MTTRPSPVPMGALVPLTRPGWTEAGRHLLAGLELAAQEVNDTGGITGRPLELMVRDTAAGPQRAAAAVDELAALGAAALAGEYHSVAARAAATRADALGLPFLCSSAVLDALTGQPTDWVARIAPAQSRGWRVYADFLLSAGHRRIAVAAEPSIYWASGAAIVRDHLAPRGGTVIDLDLAALSPAAVCDLLAGQRPDVLLVLAGYPDPAVPHRPSLAARGRRGHPRADPVLPPARHQRLAVGLAPHPGRRPGSGRPRALPGPSRLRRGRLPLIRG
jgi:ABC-type branched-subunit amino acid transport system substrate-binding protein